MRSRIAAALVLACTSIVAADQARGPKFRPDDPLTADNDRAVDVGTLPERDDSDIYDFLEHSFMGPGSRDDIPALNVNTIDEVPDSSWFTNRFANGLPAHDALARGPDTLPSLDISGWPVAEGKGEGATPGFRLRGPDGELYQLKFDPKSNPEMATSAEVIGTAFYHAFGYNVVEMYLVEFDGSSYTMLPDATISVQGGKARPLTRQDIDGVLDLSAALPNGRYRAVARKMPEGDGIGSFRYYGTRPDDPNDIFPHEHRRELRANRAFAAWLNHDDSRGINSKDIVVTEGGRRYVRHYMYDFNSILGSGNQRPQKYRSGNEYRFEGREALKALLTLGLYVRPWARFDYPDVPPAVGRFEADAFDPELWKPEYPNAAFDNMRPDDAFWAARIIARFDADLVGAIVRKARFSDPRATDYLTRTLMRRREKVLRAWLTKINPLVDFAVNDKSELVFHNVAESEGLATAADRYRVQWARFDNSTGVSTPIAEVSVREPHAPLPAALQGDAAPQFFEAKVSAIHPQFASWAEPVTVHFRRAGSSWQLVGVTRLPD